MLLTLYTNVILSDTIHLRKKLINFLESPTLLKSFKKGMRAIDENNTVALFDIIEKEPEVFNIHSNYLNSFVQKTITQNKLSLLLEFFKKGAITSSYSVAETLIQSFEPHLNIDKDNQIKEYIIKKLI